MKRALILVEGQTEERFVKDVLAPHLFALELYIIPTLLATKIVKSGPNFKGGVTSFEKFQFDLRRLLGGAGSDALVTTMLDYYRLPEQINERPGQNPATRIRTLFPGYRKPLHGPIATKRIGIQLIRDRCPHFNEWLARLERFAAAV